MISRRGQMEMIGLVVIVILITLGMLFMAIFAFNKEPSRKVFVHKGLAKSTMSALMATTLPACDAGLNKHPTLEKDLLDDCAQNHDISNPAFYGITCELDGSMVSSCDYLEHIVPQLLNETLGAWYTNYEFESVLYPEEKVLLREGPGCSGERENSGEFVLPAGSGSVKSILFVCGKG